MPWCGQRRSWVNTSKARYSGPAADRQRASIAEQALLVRGWDAHFHRLDLSEYKEIVASWSGWSAVEKQCRSLAIGHAEEDAAGRLMIRLSATQASQPGACPTQGA